MSLCPFLNWHLQSRCFSCTKVSFRRTIVIVLVLVYRLELSVCYVLSCYLAYPHALLPLSAPRSVLPISLTCCVLLSNRKLSNGSCPLPTYYPVYIAVLFVFLWFLGSIPPFAILAILPEKCDHSFIASSAQYILPEDRMLHVLSDCEDHVTTDFLVAWEMRE